VECGGAKRGGGGAGARREAQGVERQASLTGARTLSGRPSLPRILSLSLTLTLTLTLTPSLTADANADAAAPVQREERRPHAIKPRSYH
jgi:hypothetical protein